MPSNMSIPGAVAIAILVVLVLIVIVRNIYVVQQSKAYVVERLGAFHSVWGVGLHLKVPFIERVVKKVSLKEQVADFDPQPVITKDNVTMQIDTVIYFQITDPKLYTYGVEYPMNAIENLTATTLRNIIGEMELDHTLTSRDVINSKIRVVLDEATDAWGIKVNRVELKNIVPPKEIQDSMEKMKNIGTMLIVAHRLSTIQHADEIIVLSHGKIVEHGTHQELLAAQGRYYQLYTLQYHREQSEKQRGRK